MGIIAVFLAFILGVANGASDICNSAGTLFGAQVFSLKVVVILGIIFESFGALTMGALVSKTISRGILEPKEFSDIKNDFGIGLTSVLAGAALTTLCATIYGLPISATHGVIGGLIAIGLITKGPGSIDGMGVLKTSSAWIIAPVVGLIIAMLLYMLIYKVIV